MISDPLCSEHLFLVRNVMIPRAFGHYYFSTNAAFFSWITHLPKLLTVPREREREWVRLCPRLCMVPKQGTGSNLMSQTPEPRQSEGFLWLNCRIVGGLQVAWLYLLCQPDNRDSRYSICRVQAWSWLPFLCHDLLFCLSNRSVQCASQVPLPF